MREGAVGERDTVEFGENKALSVVRGQFRYKHGVGDAALDILVEGERELVEQLGLGHEHKIVILWEVLKEQTKLAESVDFHEMSVVDDRREHLAKLIESLSFLNESALADEVSALGFELEGLTEDAQCAVIRINGRINTTR